MRLSKCCRAKVSEDITEIQEVFSGHWIYSYKFFCSKCHKPCEMIDLPDERRKTMKELSKEELIKWYKRIWKTRISFGDRVFFEEEQAYQQIRQLIENQPICIFCALPITEQEGACKKCANRALEDLSHQPKVDEEFIEKWAEHLKPKNMPEAALSNYKDSIREMKND